MTRRAGLFFVISAVGFVAELAIAVTTYLPGAPLLAEATPLVLFPGIFIVHLRTVLQLISLRKAASAGRIGGVMSTAAGRPHALCYVADDDGHRVSGNYAIALARGGEGTVGCSRAGGMVTDRRGNRRC